MRKAILIVALILLAYFLINPRQNGPSTSTSKRAAAFKLEIVVQGLSVPWSIAFTSPDRILVTERTGDIRVIEKGKLRPKALATFSDILHNGEGGLLGLTLDPNYQNNHLVYSGYTYDTPQGTRVKIVRFVDRGTDISDQKTLIDEIPGGIFHNGMRLKFGPDGKLYISTGEGTNKELSQQDTTYAGKLFRMDADGSDKEIIAKGLRNSQGFDWDRQTGNLWAVDHGPSGIDGPPGGDEVNRIIIGGNYGWPLVSHENNRPGLIAPLRTFTPAIAPASLIVYDGTMFPQWKGSLFIGALRGEGLYYLVLSKDRKTIQSSEKLEGIDVGRVRDVVQGPDGSIYFTTSNRDGRGTVHKGDDKLIRITAQ